MKHERLTKREVVKELENEVLDSNRQPVYTGQIEVKKLDNNTFEVQYADGKKAIRYHHTDIITYHPNGDIVLNAGGWLTSTTKERMGYLNDRGYHISQVNKIWYLVNRSTKQEWTFKNGITIHADGTVTGNGTDPKKLLKLDKQIKKYIEGYIKALFDGKIEKPGAGDCWGCSMKDVKTGQPVMGSDHLLSHFKEKYYVPSLLMNAIEAFPISVVARSSIGYYLKYHTKECKGFDDIAKVQVKSSLRRYLRRQLGLAS